MPKDLAHLRLTRNLKSIDLQKIIDEQAQNPGSVNPDPEEVTVEGVHEPMLSVHLDFDLDFGDYVASNNVFISDRNYTDVVSPVFTADFAAGSKYRNRQALRFHAVPGIPDDIHPIRLLEQAAWSTAFMPDPSSSLRSDVDMEVQFRLTSIIKSDGKSGCLFIGWHDVQKETPPVYETYWAGVRIMADAQGTITVDLFQADSFDNLEPGSGLRWDGFPFFGTTTQPITVSIGEASLLALKLSIRGDKMRLQMADLSLGGDDIVIADENITIVPKWLDTLTPGIVMGNTSEEEAYVDISRWRLTFTNNLSWNP